MFIYLFERQSFREKGGRVERRKRERGTEGEKRRAEMFIFHLLVHSLDAWNSKGRARPRLRAWNPIQVCHAVGRNSSTWVTICCLPRLTSWKWFRSRGTRTWIGTWIWDFCTPSNSSTYCAAMPLPYSLILQTPSLLVLNLTIFSSMSFLKTSW